MFVNIQILRLNSKKNEGKPRVQVIHAGGGAPLGMLLPTIAAAVTRPAFPMLVFLFFLASRARVASDRMRDRCYWGIDNVRCPCNSRFRFLKNAMTFTPTFQCRHQLDGRLKFNRQNIKNKT